MHHKCREILADLGKEGSLIYFEEFKFPQKRPLKYVLKDLIEDEVEEKYFLSQKMLDGFIINNKSDFKFEPHEKSDEVSKCITARYFKMGKTDPYIKENLNQIGNIDTKGHNSLWGRVYDTNGIAPTQNAKGGGAGAKTGLFETSSRIRRLTPREAARIQGDFEDKFKFGKASDTKLYEFIGNAMDISTTKNLIVKMLGHLKTIKLNKPLDPSFEISKTNKQKTLF